jgi:hypothetical protein
VGAALMLAGCSSTEELVDVNESLPDLAELGLESFECGTGVAIGEDFIAPEGEWVAECWRGTPEGRFDDLANQIQVEVLKATAGTDVTGAVCPEDLLNNGDAIACRAAFVPEGTIVRTVVVLSDVEFVLNQIPENPTEADVDAALVGAPVEVLVGTEPSSSDDA